ncbi:hypothetical protein D1007_41540 [Hordeum vulgare]|nr:hypothetical protein D1007_41540 [Hordeum vulgare]
METTNGVVETGDAAVKTVALLTGEAAKTTAALEIGEAAKVTVALETGEEKPAVRIAMEVYIVETGSGSRRFTAEVGRSTTVRELKDLIREKFGIESSSWLRLFIRSKELQNRNTMDYYDIVEGTTVKFEDVS